MKLQLLRQQGATLLIGLIMLILLTLLAMTSFKLGKGSLQAVSNMQHRNQTAAAAQGAIEQVISSVTFVATPANAIPNPCGGVPNKTCVDVAGKGVRDVRHRAGISWAILLAVAGALRRCSSSP